MNALMVFLALLVSLFLGFRGLCMNTEVNDLARQMENIQAQNTQKKQTIVQKQLLTPRRAQAMSKAFSLLVNDIRYLENNSGTTMNLTVDKSNDSDDVNSHCVDSPYRGVKKLPITLQVNKFSSETDMGEVLNDIYQLEIDTDFKATEINKEGDTLIVKGDVYGI